jgi:hypothetical protein
MIVRMLFRLWRWWKAPRYDYCSEGWLQDQALRRYDDDPKAKASSWE